VAPWRLTPEEAGEPPEAEAVEDDEPAGAGVQEDDDADRTEKRRSEVGGPDPPPR
jgi:hypothetical protein